MSIFLLSEQRLKKDFLNDNIASELILPSIQTAQDIFLRQTLGDSLLDRICNMIREDELQEPYKTLLDEYIIIYLEYLAMAELCVPSTFKLGNIGIAQAYDSNVNTQTIQNVKYLESYYKQKASFYENRLTTFIQQHCNLFPEYNTITDVTISSESTLQCGIYLGGTSKKKTIINNNSNINTEVGNYVRYDKAQNLSELEKAQARENIGVSASGEIVVDLENYYTKQQTENVVSTAISNLDIPTKTSELELDNVYSKQQTDTAISTAINNINIPDTNNYYTKEQVYTKQETYNKSEVNDLIDSVNSGEVDLTNYYKKNETYSKSEVDNLVENIPTFSGNYNDLTNKPDIYTKEQVYTKQETYSVSQIDTLISQVPTFSGNYNDLTNKPTLSTVATSGSYNDLENKPELFSGSYNDLTDKPTLFNGDYNTLTNKPTIPTDTSQLTKSDIYTKAETFTRDEIVNMINEINYSDINNTPTLSTVATSGSYNDLTDKPQIYTTEQVYTKSEIDLQFAEINATLGDINNTLNEI